VLGRIRVSGGCAWTQLRRCARGRDNFRSARWRLVTRLLGLPHSPAAPSRDRSASRPLLPPEVAPSRLGLWYRHQLRPLAVEHQAELLRLLRFVFCASAYSRLSCSRSLGSKTWAIRSSMADKEDSLLSLESPRGLSAGASRPRETSEQAKGRLSARLAAPTSGSL
jgi:hypothetical protein